jgi:hypothetical protein
LSNYTNGFFAELNFSNLSSEYETTRSSGSIILKLKGMRDPGKNGPLCFGYLPLSEIKQSQTEKTIHPKAAKCEFDVSMFQDNQVAARRLIRALEFI